MRTARCSIASSPIGTGPEALRRLTDETGRRLPYFGAPAFRRVFGKSLGATVVGLRRRDAPARTGRACYREPAHASRVHGIRTAVRARRSNLLLDRQSPRFSGVDVARSRHGQAPGDRNAIPRRSGGACRVGDCVRRDRSCGGGRPAERPPCGLARDWQPGAVDARHACGGSGRLSRRRYGRVHRSTRRPPRSLDRGPAPRCRAVAGPAHRARLGAGNGVCVTAMVSGRTADSRRTSRARQLAGDRDRRRRDAGGDDGRGVGHVEMRVSCVDAGWTPSAVRVRSRRRTVSSVRGRSRDRRSEPTGRDRFERAISGRLG